MTYKDIIKKVAKETGLSEYIIDKTYRAYWKAVKEHVENLPLKDSLAEEEFCQLKVNINIPSIGKLTLPKDRYKRMTNYYNNKIK